jgi:putative lipoic acid-binding regulatory protein
VSDPHASLAERLKRLKALLEKEKFPLDYTYKFIGKNSGKFTQGLHALESTFPKLTLRGTRESAGAQHLAVTYLLKADDAEEVVSVLESVSKIDDLLVIL